MNTQPQTVNNPTNTTGSTTPMKTKAYIQNGTGHRIVITETAKERFGYRENDQWRVLRRDTVPNLSDAEWFASPGQDWREIEA